MARRCFQLYPKAPPPELAPASPPPILSPTGVSMAPKALSLKPWSCFIVPLSSGHSLRVLLACSSLQSPPADLLLVCLDMADLAAIGAFAQRRSRHMLLLSSADWRQGLIPQRRFVRFGRRRSSGFGLFSSLAPVFVLVEPLKFRLHSVSWSAKSTNTSRA